MRYAFALLLLMGCGQTRDDAHLPWYPHVVTAWRVTPGGHTRDAGPFASVEAGWTTEEQIDSFVDFQFAHFLAVIGQPAPEVPIGLNDDYVMWCPQLREWCAGMQTTGDPVIHVTLWTRVETVEEPAPCWIARPPGDYWGVRYGVWRHTDKPLCPAIAHELLHALIGDPGHTSPLWARL